MQQLRTVSNQDLNQRILSLVKSERELLTEILWHIREVDRRKLFLEMGFSSLFAYLTEYLGYSPASAQRRLDASRLLLEIPEVSTLIDSGKINLSQVSMIQQSARLAKSISAPPTSFNEKQEQNRKITAIKKDLLANLEGKTQKQTQILTAQAFSIPVQEKPLIKHQADQSVRIELTLSQEEWSKVEEMKSLLSQSVKSQDLSALLVYLADKVIKQKKGNSNKSSADSSTVSTLTSVPISKSMPITSAAEVKRAQSSNKNIGRISVPRPIRRQVFEKFNSCQYKDKTSGKICAERHFLQIEHIQPIWADGGNQIENLTVLCANHNRHVYRKQSLQTR